MHSKGINSVDIKQNRSVGTELAAFLHLECAPIVRCTPLRFLAAHDEDVRTLNFPCTIHRFRPYRLATASEDFDSGFFAGPPFKRDHLNHESAGKYVNVVRYSSDGSVFVTANAGGKVGETAHTTATVPCIATFSPTPVTRCCVPALAHGWGANHRAPTTEHRSHLGPSSSWFLRAYVRSAFVTFSAFKAFIYDGKDGSFKGELNGGAETAHGAGIYGLSFGADPTKCITCSADKTVKMWDVANNALLHTFTFPDDLGYSKTNTHRTTCIYLHVRARKTGGPCPHPLPPAQGESALSSTRANV